MFPEPAVASFLFHPGGVPVFATMANSIPEKKEFPESRASKWENFIKPEAGNHVRLR